MSIPAIRVDSIGKLYRIGRTERYQTLRDSLTGAFRSPLALFKQKPNSAEDETALWALKDISFEIASGQVLGVIGGNGAGKSTLLKVLSRITEPSTGRAEIHGRVGSLLEVGTGFHPELTGRENVYLNGAILGMRRAEIARQFDAIVEFSEVGRFIDTPVKRYSSGMYMRLAFAVAAHLTVELLFVDEVLAVGDAAFQKKCLGKMAETSRAGRTVVFVSHNMAAMRSMCDRVIRLSHGRLVDEGDPAKVIAAYLANQSANPLSRTWGKDSTKPDATGYLESAALAAGDLGAGEADGEHIDTNTPLAFTFEYFNWIEGAVLNFSLVLFNLDGVCIFNSISPARPTPVGTLRAECTVPGGFLNDGQYRIRLLVVKDTSVILCDEDEALIFEVHDAPRTVNWYGKWSGVVRPVLPWLLSSPESPQQQATMNKDGVSLART